MNLSSHSWEVGLRVLLAASRNGERAGKRGRAARKPSKGRERTLGSKQRETVLVARSGRPQEFPDNDRRRPSNKNSLYRTTGVHI